MYKMYIELTYYVGRYIQIVGLQRRRGHAERLILHNPEIGSIWNESREVIWLVGRWFKKMTSVTYLPHETVEWNLRVLDQLDSTAGQQAQVGLEYGQVDILELNNCLHYLIKHLKSNKYLYN